MECENGTISSSIRQEILEYHNKLRRKLKDGTVRSVTLPKAKNMPPLVSNNVLISVDESSSHGLSHIFQEWDCQLEKKAEDVFDADDFVNETLVNGHGFNQYIEYVVCFTEFRLVMK